MCLLAQTFPALFGLYFNGFLPKGMKVVGYARTKMDKEVSGGPPILFGALSPCAWLALYQTP